MAVYLIRSAAYNTEGNLVEVLKIGYTSRPVQERFEEHRTSNPTCVLVDVRPDGGWDLEAMMHRYWAKYLIPEADEWFWMSQDIIDHFQDFTIPVMPESVFRSEVKKKLLKAVNKAIKSVGIEKDTYTYIRLTERLEEFELKELPETLCDLNLDLSGAWWKEKGWPDFWEPLESDPRKREDILRDIKKIL